MKKSLIALAALAFAGAASAQSSVSLYGIADLYVGKTGAAGSKVSVGNGGVSASRWGVKGTEDLGGGLSANFNFEQGLDLTTGAVAAPAFQRQANVSIAGGFGAIKLGRSGSALDDIMGNTNSGFDSALSANNGAWLNPGSNVVNAQVHYTTPTFGGFAAAVSTQLSGNAPTNRDTALNITYGAGAVYAGLGYEEVKGTYKSTLLQASYDLGKAKLLGSYLTTKPTAGARINSYQLGADIPVSAALTVSVGYANSKQGATKQNAFGVAAAYALSKRTTAYAGFRAANVDANDLWAFGIKHTF
jgi:predicted porin